MTNFQQHAAAMDRAIEEGREYSYICADGTKILMPLKRKERAA